MTKYRCLIILSSLSLMPAGALTGCSGDSSQGGISVEGAGQLDTDPPDRISFSASLLTDGQETQYELVMLQNSGEGPLTIKSISVEEDDSEYEFVLLYEVPKYEFGDKAGQERENDVRPEELCPKIANFQLTTRDESEDEFYCLLFVVYRPSDENPDFGSLVVRSDDPVIPEKKIDIATLGSGAQISVEPPGEVLFEDVLTGEEQTRTVTIRNVGTASLELNRLELVNNANGDFRWAFNADSPHQAVPTTLRPQVPDDYVAVDVTYKPSRAGTDSGRIHIESNDEGRELVEVRLTARSIFPCVQISPMDVDFRQVLIGTPAEQLVDITNCGNAELLIDEIKMVGGSSEEFRIVTPLEGLSDDCTKSCAALGQEACGDYAHCAWTDACHRSPDFAAEDNPACSGEVEIPGNSTKSFLVQYNPIDEGADGGVITIHTNVSGKEEQEVSLYGRGTNNTPPVSVCEARIAGAPEFSDYPDEENLLETIPLKTLELQGSNSYDPDGTILGYKWTVVTRPADSTAQIAPHEGSPDVTFFLDLAGRYEFELEVTDNHGQSSNPNCRIVADAIPDEDIHVQLVWHTPADPDETDTGFGAGSDVDLHFLHPLGDWFCSPYDNYYANPNPDWGSPFDPSDDPSLDIDDTDGAGPENVNLNNPEANRVYRVGVHYFNDHGYGPSFVTLRIYIQGQLRFELANKRMAGTDRFWDVGTIAWPSGHITPIDRVLDAAPQTDCP